MLTLEKMIRVRLIRAAFAASKGVFGFIKPAAVSEFVGPKTRLIGLKTVVSQESHCWLQRRESLGRRAEQQISYTIGLVGAIDLEQGVLDLLEAVAAARIFVPEIRVLLIGAVDDACRAEFEAAKSRLDIQDIVEVTGWLNFEQMLTRISSCDVGLYLRKRSGWSESAFPLKICEHLGAVIPTVSWDYPGCRALLNDGKYGSLVPPGDATCLVKELVRMADLSTRERIRLCIQDNMNQLLADGSYRQLLSIASQPGNREACKETGEVSI